MQATSLSYSWLRYIDNFDALQYGMALFWCIYLKNIYFALVFLFAFPFLPPPPPTQESNVAHGGHDMFVQRKTIKARLYEKSESKGTPVVLC